MCDERSGRTSRPEPLLALGAGWAPPLTNWIAVCMVCSTRTHGVDLVSISREADETAMKALARALAPYMADELSRRVQAQDASNVNYDAATCARYVAELGTGVLQRSLILFDSLARDGRTDSPALSAALRCRPPALAGSLTTPIKRRAKTLGLPLPFDGGHGSVDFGGISDPLPGDDPGRTYWADRNGIAARMLQAVEDELIRRA